MRGVVRRGGGDRPEWKKRKKGEMTSLAAAGGGKKGE